MSRQDAENLFFEQAKTAAREKAYVNRTPNQYALLEAQQRFALAKEAAKAKNKGKGKGDDDTHHLTRMQLMDYDLANKSNSWIKENTELSKIAGLETSNNNSYDQSTYFNDCLKSLKLFTVNQKLEVLTKQFSTETDVETRRKITAEMSSLYAIKKKLI